MKPKSCPPRALSAIEIARMQREIGRLVCSAAWFEHCWAQVAARRIRAKGRMDHALDRARLYPPGGVPRPAARVGTAADHPTLMQRCAACRSRWYPPQYVRGCGLCEDCAAAIGREFENERTHRGSTESATALAMHDLGYYRVRLVEARLPAEDEASLRREIQANQLGQQGSNSARSKNTKKHDF